LRDRPSPELGGHAQGLLESGKGENAPFLKRLRASHDEPCLRHPHPAANPCAERPDHLRRHPEIIAMAGARPSASAAVRARFGSAPGPRSEAAEVAPVDQLHSRFVRRPLAGDIDVHARSDRAQNPCHLCVPAAAFLRDFMRSRRDADARTAADRGDVRNDWRESSRRSRG